MVLMQVFPMSVPPNAEQRLMDYGSGLMTLWLPPTLEDVQIESMSSVAPFLNQKLCYVVP